MGGLTSALRAAWLASLPDDGRSARSGRGSRVLDGRKGLGGERCTGVDGDPASLRRCECSRTGERSPAERAPPRPAYIKAAHTSPSPRPQAVSASNPSLSRARSASLPSLTRHSSSTPMRVHRATIPCGVSRIGSSALHRPETTGGARCTGVPPSIMHVLRPKSPRLVTGQARGPVGRNSSDV